MIIKFGMEIWCGSDEPNRCVYRYNGEILGWEEDDDSDEPNVKLGEIDVYYCDRIRALDEGQGFWAAMDDAGHDTMECYEALIDQKTGDWKRAVREFVGEDALIMDNVLLINRLELEERFRGKGLARKVVDEVIKTFRSQCAVIACKPFPLQYSGYMSSENESEVKSPDDEKRRRGAFKKVAAFWRAAGFRKLPSSEFYLLGGS